MAGKIISLMPKRRFNFGSILMGATQRYVVCEQIDISQHCDGVLITRVHQCNFAGGQIDMYLQPDGYTPRDSLVFVGPSGTYFNVVSRINNSTPAGTLIAQGNAEGEFRGEYAMLIMDVIRSFAGSMIVELSIDLLLRTPDDVDNIVPQAVEKCGGCSCSD